MTEQKYSLMSMMPVSGPALRTAAVVSLVGAAWYTRQELRQCIQQCSRWFVESEHSTTQQAPPQLLGLSPGQQEVSLSGHALSSIPSSLWDAQWLIRLDLSSCSLAVLPPAIQRLQRLETLNLTANALESLPAQIGSLQHLKDLNLASNLLTTLPPEIGLLKRLVYLNVMANRLEHLPDELGDLSALYRLGLKSNRLVALPASIGRLHSLVELFLTDNLLESLPQVPQLPLRMPDHPRHHLQPLAHTMPQWIEGSSPTANPAAGAGNLQPAGQAAGQLQPAGLPAAAAGLPAKAGAHASCCQLPHRGAATLSLPLCTYELSDPVIVGSLSTPDIHTSQQVYQPLLSAHQIAERLLQPCGCCHRCLGTWRAAQVWRGCRWGATRLARRRRCGAARSGRLPWALWRWGSRSAMAHLVMCSQRPW